MPLPAIAGMIAAAASVAVSAASAASASKQKGILQSESAGERAMLNLQKQKAADLSAMGGLSAGQYQRAQMPEDILAQQTQTMVNTMASSPLISAFRKEAFAKMALAKTKQGILQNQIRIEDMDEQRAAKNAFMASEAAERARAGEAVITARENERRRQELAQKQMMWQSFSKMAASTGKLIGAGVDYFENRTPSSDSIDFEGSYNPQGDIGVGFDTQLTQPDMLTGVQQMPTSDLQGGLSDEFQMPTGLPSLTDGLNTTLPTLDPALMNPASGINTTMSYEQILKTIDPTQYY